MTLSTLITHLQALQEEIGDAPVGVDVRDYFTAHSHQATILDSPKHYRLTTSVWATGMVMINASLKDYDGKHPKVTFRK